METKKELNEIIIGDSKKLFYEIFEENPDYIFSLFETIDQLLELMKVDAYIALELISYKNGKELEKLFKTADDFIKMHSTHKDFSQLLFIHSEHVQSLFNTPDLIIQLAVDPTCCLKVLSIKNHDKVREIFKDYQINEPLLQLANLKRKNNLAILIGYCLPVKLTPVEHFNTLLDIMKNNPSLEKHEINNLEQYFIRKKDIHLGSGLFSVMTNVYENICSIYEQYFPQNNSSTQDLQ